MNHRKAPPSMRLSMLLIAGMLLAAAPALAQQPSRPAPMPGTETGPATMSPMMQAMDKTNKAMAAVHPTGNTDQDFVAMMMPHHQGAIDMAKVELAQGKDPVLRRLARNIIAAQEREIRLMKRWQAKHPAKAD